jgi:uncharacterized membrane protein (UPF0136 family)
MTLWVVLILVYGLLVAVGGVFGYLKAKSQVSLFSGLGSGTALLIAAYWASREPVKGLSLAVALAIFLLITFTIRWLKTRALMPAGLMAGLSLAAAIAFGIGLAQSVTGLRFAY